MIRRVVTYSSCSIKKKKKSWVKIWEISIKYRCDLLEMAIRVFPNGSDNRMKLIWALAMKLTVGDGQIYNIITMREYLEWQKNLISH